MKKKQLNRDIIIYEAIGFILIIIFLWLDELLDVPSIIMGQSPTPINLSEAIFETILIAILGASVIVASYNLLKKIKYLEGFLQVCPFCNKINVAEKWMPLQEFIKKHSDATFANGLCPDCAQEHFEGLEETVADNFHEIIKKH